ncbi:MAG: hypothetical protein KGZ80_05110 [Methylomonas sp.]|nr:hypothetical protein [Methylomonas sp.]PPD20119.1 MAG: hypothetical protein CTY23_09825 [Methylomonas sp.]PPD25162.1 MAG: hypothetical protein CTY22_09575 [Methylomonas sp.]PPD34668.1 MAG: hypothetical protein CTY21_09680 [Methylomonas sp.]PPD37919.1 MAG: hypothetical protein CTY17_10230 [Methylomonas sp.]
MYKAVIEVSPAENTEAKQAFWQDAELGLLQSSEQLAEVLAALTGKVARQPKDLVAHLRRVHFCFQHALADALYAALLDVVIVLDGKGQDLTRRLMAGCRGRLNAADLVHLKNLRRTPRQPVGNRHSLFTSGVRGTFDLIENRQGIEHTVEPLLLARDFIEYSQLDEAMTVLETALLETPERNDIQTALAELYRSTDSRGRFLKTHRFLHAMAVDLSADWRNLALTFAGETP